MSLLANVGLVATEATTTTAVPRIAGDPLPSWVVIAVGIGVLLFVLIGGALTNRHLRKDR